MFLILTSSRGGRRVITDVPKELIDKTADIPGLDLVPEEVELDPPLVLDDSKY